MPRPAAAVAAVAVAAPELWWLTAVIVLEPVSGAVLLPAGVAAPERTFLIQAIPGVIDG